MKIAIPMAEGRLAMHFGHCEQFAIIEVEPDTHAILHREDVTPPPHQPGLLPPWLAEQGVTLVIAGGMGQRAQALFIERGITVLVGAPSESPDRLIADYHSGNLALGNNACDH